MYPIKNPTTDSDHQKHTSMGLKNIVYPKTKNAAITIYVHPVNSTIATFSIHNMFNANNIKNIKLIELYIVEISKNHKSQLCVYIWYTSIYHIKKTILPKISNVAFV